MSVASVASQEGSALAFLDSSQGRAIWRRFRRQRGGLVGLVVLALMVAGVIVEPIVNPLAATAVSIPLSATGGGEFIIPANSNPDMWFASAGTTDPATGLTYWLGSDKLGRDMLSRLFIGGRVTLPAALIAAILTTLLGTLIGLIAGFFGGWVDTIIMRVTDFMLAWPLIPAFILTYTILRGSLPISGYIDNTSSLVPLFTFLILTFLLFSWMGVARLVRISVLSLREQQFIEATRALGAGNARIIFKHLLPNVLTPVVVAGTLMVGDFVLFEALLAFFGSGITEPPGPSWGSLLVYGQTQIYAVTDPNPFENIRFFMFLFPCFMILITVLSINAVADALRKAMAITWS